MRFRLTAAAILLLAPLAAPGAARADDPGSAPAPAGASGDVQARRSPIVRAVEKARPGIVSIRTNQIVLTRGWYDFEYEQHEQEAALGSGSIFHPDGYVITNAHVIARASRIFVQVLQGTPEEFEREAKVVAVDLDNDLAVLRMLPAANGAAGPYRFLPLGRSNDLMIGETVIAVGNPFGVGTTVTTGVISALRRSIKPRGSKEEREFKDFIQIDAAINPGNSGGPVLDITGRWIGVNTAILNRAMGAEGIGFAIPADRMRDMIGRLFKRRLITGEWLGLEFEAGADGSPVVSAVFPEGPARESGLRRGDRVLAINGAAVDSLYAARLAEIAAPGGEPVRLRVAREGEREGGSAIEASIPMSQVPTSRLSRERMGFEAQDLDPTLNAGVLVKEILPSGAAASAGMRVNDVIVGLGRAPIRNLDDLLVFLEYVQHGDAVDVKVRRLVETAFGTQSMIKSGTMLVP